MRKPSCNAYLVLGCATLSQLNESVFGCKTNYGAMYPLESSEHCAMPVRLCSKAHHDKLSTPVLSIASLPPLWLFPFLLQFSPSAVLTKPRRGPPPHFFAFTNCRSIYIFGGRHTYHCGIPICRKKTNINAPHHPSPTSILPDPPHGRRPVVTACLVLYRTPLPLRARPSRPKTHDDEKASNGDHLPGFFKRPKFAVCEH